MMNPDLKILDWTDNTITIQAIGFLGVTQMTLPLSVKDFSGAYVKWHNGDLIQNAFPMLNAVQREFLLSGMLPHEQAMVFHNVQPEDN